MIKIYKQTDDKPIKIGIFKSFVEFANWLDEEPEKRKGKYHSIPSHCTTLASMKSITFDGVFCEVEGRGFV